MASFVSRLEGEEPQDVQSPAAAICEAHAEATGSGGILAARSAGKARAVTARLGAKGGRRILHIHFAAREWAGPHPAGPLSGLGRGPGGGPAGIRSRIDVVLRPHHLRHRVWPRTAIQENRSGRRRPYRREIPQSQISREALSPAKVAHKKMF